LFFVIVLQLNKKQANKTNDSSTKIISKTSVFYSLSLSLSLIGTNPLAP